MRSLADAWDDAEDEIYEVMDEEDFRCRRRKRKKKRFRDDPMPKKVGKSSTRPSAAQAFKKGAGAFGSAAKVGLDKFMEARKQMKEDLDRQ